MVVWQPSTDTMWEFWRARRMCDGWHARYGGRMTNVSTNPGYYTDPNPRWGATATSLPLLGGLMRLDELDAGRIDHALALALPEITARAFSWPAQRTDGASQPRNAIPAGHALPHRPEPRPRHDRDVADRAHDGRAAQRYGMVVRDGGGAVAFYAEDPTPTGPEPVPRPGGLFGGRYISNSCCASSRGSTSRR